MSGCQPARAKFGRFATANPYRGGLADIQFARCRADCCLRGWVCSGSLSPMARSGLGKGLGALIGTPSVAAVRQSASALIKNKTNTTGKEKEHIPCIH